MSLFDSFGQFGWLFLLAVLVIIVLIKTAVVVPNQSAYVVERLGKFHKVLYAGFHLLLPFVDVTAYKRSLKEQVLYVPKQTCITRDNVSVDIDGVLYLQVITPEKSAYGISDYEWGAIQLAQTSLRSVIGKLELDKTFEERTRINQEVVEALDAATAPWGVKVLRYEIRDITPPATVMEAMEKGDLETAREMQWKSVEIIDVLIKHGGGVRAGKIFMKLAGIDCGPCRLPIAPCSEEELEETRNELKNTEFFKYIN